MPLPTITEGAGVGVVVMAPENNKEENGSVKDSHKQSARRKGRGRTISENDNPGDLSGSRGKLGVKSPVKEGRIPRNQSAPHFAVANRNMSTTFTPLNRSTDYIDISTRIISIRANPNCFTVVTSCFCACLLLFVVCSTG